MATNNGGGDGGLKIVELLKVADSLKHLKRTGWVRCNVPEPETVASHMYRMALLAWSLRGHPACAAVDMDKCLRMSLVHDIGEALIGDITPFCGVSDQSKYEQEKRAVETISSLVPSVTGDEWLALWREYETAETQEAGVVKQLDKFDMIAQAADYEQKYGLDLSDFFTSTVNSFTTEPFVSWNRELRERREAARKEKQ